MIFSEKVVDRAKHARYCLPINNDGEHANHLGRETMSEHIITDIICDNAREWGQVSRFTEVPLFCALGECLDFDLDIFGWSFAACGVRYLVGYDGKEGVWAGVRVADSDFRGSANPSALRWESMSTVDVVRLLGIFPRR